MDGGGVCTPLGSLKRRTELVKGSQEDNSNKVSSERSRPVLVNKEKQSMCMRRVTEKKVGSHSEVLWRSRVQQDPPELLSPQAPLDFHKNSLSGLAAV